MAGVVATVETARARRREAAARTRRREAARAASASAAADPEEGGHLCRRAAQRAVAMLEARLAVGEGEEESEDDEKLELCRELGGGDLEDLRAKGIESANDAVRDDNAGNYEDAINCKAVEYLMTVRASRAVGPGPHDQC